MNDAQREQLADAVLDSLDTGLAVDRTALDAAARAELRAFEDAAALACAAFAQGAGPMPAALAQRVRAEGRAIVAARSQRPAAVPARPTAARPWLPFAVGLAAGIAATMLLFADRAAPAPTERRLALLQAPATARVHWQQGPSQRHGAIRGDVVWNAERQEGYLRIDGLEPLGKDQQYQLWIVDGDRTGAPVDGGLFDLTRTGETVVPITARLPVATAKAFVVTVEKRGGVVVSGQEDVVAIASP